MAPATKSCIFNQVRVFTHFFNVCFSFFGPLAEPLRVCFVALRRHVLRVLWLIFLHFPHTNAKPPTSIPREHSGSPGRGLWGDTKTVGCRQSKKLALAYRALQVPTKPIRPCKRGIFPCRPNNWMPFRM